MKSVVRPLRCIQWENEERRGEICRKPKDARDQMILQKKNTNSY